MRKLISISFLLLGTFALAGCSAISSGKDALTRDSAVTGTVTYLQRIALPSDAVVTVRIEDVSLADAPAVLIGEQVIQTRGAQVPIPFEVPYDPGEIVENHTYSMRARIEDRAGNLLFINDTSVPVITGGNPTQDIEIIVVPAGG